MRQCHYQLQISFSDPQSFILDDSLTLIPIPLLMPRKQNEDIAGSHPAILSRPFLSIRLSPYRTTTDIIGEAEWGNTASSHPANPQSLILENSLTLIPKRQLAPEKQNEVMLLPVLIWQSSIVHSRGFAHLVTTDTTAAYQGSIMRQLPAPALIQRSSIIYSRGFAHLDTDTTTDIKEAEWGNAVAGSHRTTLNRPFVL